MNGLGSDRIRVEALASQISILTQDLKEKDPQFYSRFSDKVAQIIEAIKTDKLADAMALEELQLIRDNVLNKDRTDLPERIFQVKPADVLYRNLKNSLKVREDIYQEAILDICQIIKDNVRVDWWRNAEIKRIIRNKIDDYLYDELHAKGLKLSALELEDTLDKIMKLIENNHTDFE